MVGFFVSGLVCGSRWPVIPRVAELLGQVRGRCLAAFEHQDVPFEVLASGLTRPGA